MPNPQAISKTGATMRIGVISDTHGLLRPEALAALQGCERIIHGHIGTFKCKVAKIFGCAKSARKNQGIEFIGIDAA